MCLYAHFLEAKIFNKFLYMKQSILQHRLCGLQPSFFSLTYLSSWISSLMSTHSFIKTYLMLSWKFSSSILHGHSLHVCLDGTMLLSWLGQVAFHGCPLWVSTIHLFVIFSLFSILLGCFPLLFLYLPPTIVIWSKNFTITLIDQEGWFMLSFTFIPPPEVTLLVFSLLLSQVWMFSI